MQVIRQPTPTGWDWIPVGAATESWWRPQHVVEIPNVIKGQVLDIFARVQVANPNAFTCEIVDLITLHQSWPPPYSNYNVQGDPTQGAIDITQIVGTDLGTGNDMRLGRHYEIMAPRLVHQATQNWPALWATVWIRSRSDYRPGPGYGLESCSTRGQGHISVIVSP